MTAAHATSSTVARRQRLIQRRKALGLTQEALAELVDVGRSTVVRWERGESEPLPSIRARLARALKVSAESLESQELHPGNCPSRPRERLPALVRNRSPDPLERPEIETPQPPVAASPPPIAHWLIPALPVGRCPVRTAPVTTH